MSTSSLINDIKEVYRLFRPYFGFDAKNRWRVMAVVVILVGCLTASVMMVYIQNAISVLSALIITQGVTFGALGGAIGACLVPILCYATISSICALVTSWLSDNLAYELGSSLIAKWIDQNAFYGIRFIDSDNININPAVVLGDDLNEICKSSTTLGSSSIQAFLDFTVGAYQLYLLSVPLVINLLSLSMTIPGYMMIGALIYAVGYGLIVHLIDKNLTDIFDKFKKKKDSLNKLLHHIDDNGEPIAMKMGNSREKDLIIRKLQKFSLINASKRTISALLAFVDTISMNISFMFGLLLSAPGIISGKLDPNNAFSVAQYFTAVVNFFSWKKKNTDSFSSLNTSLARFNAFQNLMIQWEKIQGTKKLRTLKNPQRFGVKKLTIKTPAKKVLLKKCSFTIPKGKAMVIQGPSGIGKTTLFRSLAGLWPYVEGGLVLPLEKMKSGVKIYYIPQQTYFPYRSTLLNAIIYPHNVVSPTQRKKVISLMNQLGFKQETIQALDQKRGWGKILSHGEKQRIAIIGAIIKNPDVLFMDEGISGLDPEIKTLVEAALKKHLKGKTIIAIDHHVNEGTPPVVPFFDYAMKINKPKNNDTCATIQVQRFIARQT